jgi:hypothetical protein
MPLYLVLRDDGKFEVMFVPGVPWSGPHPLHFSGTWEFSGSRLALTYNPNGIDAEFFPDLADAVASVAAQYVWKESGAVIRLPPAADSSRPIPFDLGIEYTFTFSGEDQDRYH